MQIIKTWKIVPLSLVGLGVFFLPLLEAVSFGSALAVGIFLSVLVMSLRRKPELIVIILFSLLIHAQWGVAEFIIQDDLNLRLLGETQLSIDKVGIAKFGAEKTLRAYGPYKHANSFGGVMVISLALLVMASARNYFTLIWKCLAFVIVLAIFVSFSRSALISLLFLFFLMMKRQNFCVNCFGLLPLFMVLVLVFTPFYIDRFSDPLDVGRSERLSGYSWSWQIIADNGLWKGVGFGKYKGALESELIDNGIDYNSWQIDYVHSIPLLVISVLGVFPTIIILAVLVGLMRRYVSGFKFVLILSVVPLLLFDHYLVTQISPFVYLLLLITI